MNNQASAKTNVGYLEDMRIYCQCLAIGMNGHIVASRHAFLILKQLRDAIEKGNSESRELADRLTVFCNKFFGAEHPVTESMMQSLSLVEAAIGF